MLALATAAEGGAAGAKTTVVYLDPHSVQPTVDVSQDSASTESYHCRSVRTMRLGQIDPSLTIGFLVRSQADFDGERQHLNYRVCCPCLCFSLTRPSRCCSAVRGASIDGGRRNLRGVRPRADP